MADVSRRRAAGRSRYRSASAATRRPALRAASGRSKSPVGCWADRERRLRSRSSGGAAGAACFDLRWKRVCGAVSRKPGASAVRCTFAGRSSKSPPGGGPGFARPRAIAPLGGWTSGRRRGAVATAGRRSRPVGVLLLFGRAGATVEPRRSTSLDAGARRRGKPAIVAGEGGGCLSRRPACRGPEPANRRRSPPGPAATSGAQGAKRPSTGLTPKQRPRCRWSRPASAGRRNRRRRRPRRRRVPGRRWRPGTTRPRLPAGAGRRGRVGRRLGVEPTGVSRAAGRGCEGKNGP